jgi:hypothetical protein
MSTWRRLHYLGPGLASSQQTGKVVGVNDGDPISVLLNDTAIRVRLNGIDFPSHPFGNRAKQLTSDNTRCENALFAFLVDSRILRRPVARHKNCHE